MIRFTHVSLWLRGLALLGCLLGGHHLVAQDSFLDLVEPKRPRKVKKRYHITPYAGSGQPPAVSTVGLLCWFVHDPSQVEADLPPETWHWQRMTTVRGEHLAELTYQYGWDDLARAIQSFEGTCRAPEAYLNSDAQRATYATAPLAFSAAAPAAERARTWLRDYRRDLPAVPSGMLLRLPTLHDAYADAAMTQAVGQLAQALDLDALLTVELRCHLAEQYPWAGDRADRLLIDAIALSLHAAADEGQPGALLAALTFEVGLPVATVEQQQITEVYFDYFGALMYQLGERLMEAWHPLAARE